MTKRLFDIALAVTALTFLLIPLCVLMVLVRVSSTGPALYWSARVGQHGKIFYMPKLRTMVVSTPEMPTHQLSDPDKYITPIGRFLRVSSLDELPQLFSVFMGDMSFVGPRPMIPKYEELVEQRRRAGVESLRPGITGWAQVNGRDNISTQQKLDFDIEYLRRCSLLFDVYIIFRTVLYVFLAKGVKH